MIASRLAARLLGSDILVGVTGAPDADYRPEAAADAKTDSEAEAQPGAVGVITPLKRRE